MFSALNGAAARTDEPRSLRIALFLGSDITAHSIANALVPELLDRDHAVTLYLTEGHPKKGAPKPLHELFFCEHTLLQRYGYPYLDRHAKPDPDRPNSPGCWRALGRHGVRITSVRNVNDPEFIGRLRRDKPDVSVSLRCYQKFGPEIIDLLGHQPGSYLVNLHPGILPRYRGVLTVLRSMQEGADETGFTLHHVEPEFDTGAVISQAIYPLDYELPVLDNLTRRYQRGADLVLDMIDQVAVQNSVDGVPQEPDQAQYYSYATPADLAELRRRGIELFRSDSVVDSICDTFGATVPEPTGLRTELRAALHSAGIPPTR